MTNENETQKLTEMETDVIGEVMNISMGSAATAMSTILDKKVNITTPRIETIGIQDFEFSYLEPVVGVLIRYVEGIDGTNILLLREADLKKILGHLLSMDPDEPVELDEISVSAICEIMNQMMGSAAGALASFLGHVVNISPPEIMDTTNRDNIRQLFSITGDSLVSIKFNLSIDGLVESEFISAMDPLLAKEIVKMSLGASDFDSESATIGMSEDIAAPEIQAGAPASTPTEFPSVPDPSAYAQVPNPGQMSAPQASVQTAMPNPTQAPQPPMAGMPSYAPYYTEPQAPAMPKQQVHASPYTYKSLGPESPGELNLNENNLDLIMTVPIQITVELGKTRKKIKDIADLTVGNIVELDRQAGDQVDVVANGRLIARGDVVVVDDNYSVRITEIVKAKEPADSK